MKKQFLILLRLAIMAIFCFGGSLAAQPPGTVSPTVTMNGFSLQKSVSVSSIKTNDPFTYTVTFSIPGGANTVDIFDNVPAPLIIDAVIVPVGGYSGNVPTVTTVGNLVKLSFPSVASSISGSFQINVHFPVDKSCHNLEVANFSQLIAKLPETNISTERIFTKAIVNNPWRIQKYPTAPYISTCPYGTLTDEVEYNIRIVKQWWTLSGSASLYTVNLFDILPAGATVLPATYSSSANMSPSSINAAGVITLPGGFSLDATGNNYYTAKFKVAFSPPIPNGSCVINTGVLQGKYNCNGTPSALYSDTSRVGIEKTVPTANGVLQKWYTVTGNVPGCTGTYFVRVCNTGTAAMSPYVLSDAFPNTCLTGVTLGTIPAGCSITGGPATYTINGTSLSPGLCHTYSFNFTIGTGCAGPITNTVSVTSGFTSPPRSASIYLLPNVATPCLTKSVCGPTSYTVGSQVRLRFRVQNIGGTPIVGGSIFDTLDIGNLEYVPGNELYYYFPTPFAGCASNTTTPPVGGTLWTGVTTAHNATLGRLQWNLPSLGVECGNVAYPACGFAYGLRAYYIEFTVKIKDTAGLGNLLNLATIKGGNIVTPVVAPVTFLVNGNLNYNVSKEVSADGGATFSNAVTASAGSLVQFKLKSQNTGIPLINALLVDLLPRDNNGGGVVDNYIMSPASRGSVFDIRYNSFISSSHTIAASGQQFSLADGITTLPELGYTVNSNAPSWAATPFLNAVNLKTKLSQSIGAVPPLDYVFDAKTSSTATDGQVACNSYVLRPSAKYIINYQPYYVLQPSSADALKTCVTIQNTGCCEPYGFDIDKVVCVGISQQFCVLDSCKQPGNVYSWDFGDGSPVVTGKCVNHAYTATGSYTVTVYWRNECGEYKKEFKIDVKDCPCDINVNYKVSTDGLTIVADGTGTTSSLPIVLYVWSFGDGTYGTGMVTTHTYATPGTYLVTLTVHAMDANGDVCKCVKDCRTEIRVEYDKKYDFECGNPQLSMAKIANSNIVLKASPNPFTSRLTISADFADKAKAGNPSNYVFELTNVNGTSLQSKKLVNFESNVIFDTPGYAAGLYMVMLKSKTGQIQSIKVVKLN
jgi:PKD repeat protein